MVEQVEMKSNSHMQDGYTCYKYIMKK